MPKRPPRACTYPGCKEYATDGTARCPKHKQESNWHRHRAKHGNSRHKAGYGSDWDKLRKSILIRDGYLCQVCLKLGQHTEATQVDHIVNKAIGGTNHPSNLQAICKPCHDRKTRKEAVLAKYHKKPK